MQETRQDVRTTWSTFRMSMIAGAVIAVGAVAMGHADEPGQLDFNQDVRPILSNHCWTCHGPDQVARKADLRLDLAETAHEKSASGKLIIAAGQPEASELVVRIHSHDVDLLMPPPSTNKPLSEQQKRTLAQWIRQGGAYEKHWAFVAPRKRERPLVRSVQWPRNEIDYFVLQSLEQHDLEPAVEADPSVWLRRVTLDLTGLPPSVEHLDSLIADLRTMSREEAYEHVVDQLLTTPAYAERMAMLWLDAARYADTNGYNNDEARTMWPWRDWVISAFRDDMPYDQFLTEQLAGDLLPDSTVSQKVATGFNRNHVLTTEGGIIEEEYHVEYVADRVHTAATVFMAMSMQCARCHDHKFDPISQQAYYQFAAFFNNVPDKVVGYSQGKMADPTLLLATPEQQMELAGLDVQIAALQALTEKNSQPPSDAERTKSDHNEPKQQLEQLIKRRSNLDKSIPRTMIMAEQPERRPTYILKRGAYDQRAEEVESNFPTTIFDLAAVNAPFLSAAGSEKSPALAAPTPSVPPTVLTRLDLAHWLTHSGHPLTARVEVNRLWEMLFGTGIVETSEDFGAQGTPPSHPALLDWLALELAKRNWSQRSVLKEITLSATYRQSSRVSHQHLEKDPRNRLLSRGPRFRLPAETVRDHALFVSNLLAIQVGGASVMPYQPEGLWEDVSVERREKYVAATGDGLYRRSLYTFWKRTCPPPGMSTFDAPDRESCVVRRSRTNTPLQALVLLNDPTYVEASRKLAERICQSAAEDSDRIRLAFRIVLSREPTQHEAETLTQVVQSARSHFTAGPSAADQLLAVGAAPRDTNVPPVEHAAWTTTMSMLLNLDEAITRP